MEFNEVVKNRYSCKKFSSRQVGKEELEDILEAGRLSPTAKNLQEQRIYERRIRYSGNKRTVISGSVR